MVVAHRLREGCSLQSAPSQPQCLSPGSLLLPQARLTPPPRLTPSWEGERPHSGFTQRPQALP